VVDVEELPLCSLGQAVASVTHGLSAGLVRTPSHARTPVILWVEQYTLRLFAFLSKNGQGICTHKEDTGVQ
jgi:hypothetical protein